jgi:hypothetical protein
MANNKSRRTETTLDNLSLKYEQINEPLDQNLALHRTDQSLPDLIPSPNQNSLASPEIFDPERDVQRARAAARALMGVIEATKTLKLNGKTYLFFEHWQTIGQFFNHSVGIDWVKELEDPGGYEAKSILYHNDQVVGGAIASCTRDESNWKTKPDFQLRSMAQTRAMAKALRSRFGFIAVLAGAEPTAAEEITPDNKHSKYHGDGEMIAKSTRARVVHGMDGQFSNSAEIRNAIENAASAAELENIAREIDRIKNRLGQAGLQMLRGVYREKRRELVHH